MQNIINSVNVNSRVAAVEGWSVSQVTSCIKQLVNAEKVRMDAIMEELDQKLRDYAGSDYERVKNLYPSQLGDEPWEQDCAEIISQQMEVWEAAYHCVPCVYEVAYHLDVEPSNALAECIEQLDSHLSFWGENIVGRD